MKLILFIYLLLLTVSGYSQTGKLTGQLTVPQPRPYLYADDSVPHCPIRSSDQVIPIVYGKPTENTIRDAKSGKVFLGGCVVSARAPHYYCTVHHTKF